MNIHEFCTRFHVSKRRAAEMYKAGALLLEPVNAENVADIRARLLSGAKLSPIMLIRLIENPELIVSIGGKPEKRARDQLRTLCDAFGKIQPAPREVAAGIMESSYGEETELARLCAWLRNIIPSRPVPHAFIGVRLLLGLPATMREEMAKPINSALSHARRSPELAGWWRVDKSRSRPETFYEKPKIPFDL